MENKRTIYWALKVTRIGNKPQLHLISDEDKLNITNYYCPIDCMMNRKWTNPITNAPFWLLDTDASLVEVVKALS